MATTPVTAKDSFLQTFMQPDAAAKDKTLEDKFMTLLLTQVRNQDPLNPMDNSQMTSQLAQISTVNGIDKLNRTFQQMSESMIAAQQFQAGSLIGRGVLSTGNSVTLAQGQAAGGVTLDQPADDVVVRVLGPNGERLATLDLGARPAGVNPFTWDGKTEANATAPDGIYVFQVDAVQGNKKIPVQTLGFGRVQSVTLGAGETVLNTAGLGSVAMGDVKQIL
jgi:flagellar basal-body rod modification protein FlgD